jgi:hypothetical protein
MRDPGSGIRSADRDRRADTRDNDQAAPQQPLLDGVANGRLHDLVNRHRLSATGDRVALQRYVPSSPLGRDAILYDREHHQRGDGGSDENRARP